MDKTTDLDMEKNRRKHIMIRFMAIIIVTIIIFGWLMIDMKQKESRKKVLSFDHVLVTVEWKDQENITINLNKSRLYRIKIIGINTETGHEVEESNLSSHGEENKTFYIGRLMDNDMEVWIEIEDLTYNVREKQQWW